jgi:hypothetical protein
MNTPETRDGTERYWDRPDEGGKNMKRPTSVGQLLWKSRWETRLADWITSMAIGVGLQGSELPGFEAERVCYTRINYIRKYYTQLLTID